MKLYKVILAALFSGFLLIGLSACEKNAEEIGKAIDDTASDIADKTGEIASDIADETEDAVDAVKNKLDE